MTFTEDDIKRHVMVMLDQQGNRAVLDESLEANGLDSLDMAELLVEIETLYDLKVPDDEVFIRPEAHLVDVITHVYRLICEQK